MHTHYKLDLQVPTIVKHSVVFGALLRQKLFVCVCLRALCLVGDEQLDGTQDSEVGPAAVRGPVLRK